MHSVVQDLLNDFLDGVQVCMRVNNNNIFRVGLDQINKIRISYNSIVASKA